MLTALLENFHPHLKHLDYPNINYLNKEETLKIFHANNRTFLLQWLIEKIEPTLHLDPSSDNFEKALADFIFENGFCEASEKDRFVCGDPTLDFLTQLDIVNSLFLYAIHLSEEVDDSARQIDIDCLEANFNSKVVNLFPSQGPVKKMSHDEYLEKIDDLQKECDELHWRTTELERRMNQESKACNVDVDRETDTEINMNELKQCVASIKTKTWSLNQKNILIPRSTCKLEEDKNKLETMETNVESVLKVNDLLGRLMCDSNNFRQSTTSKQSQNSRKPSKMWLQKMCLRNLSIF